MHPNKSSLIEVNNTRGPCGVLSVPCSEQKKRVRNSSCKEHDVILEAKQCSTAVLLAFGFTTTDTKITTLSHATSRSHVNTTYEG